MISIVCGTRMPTVRTGVWREFSKKPCHHSGSKVMMPAVTTANSAAAAMKGTNKAGFLCVSHANATVKNPAPK